MSTTVVNEADYLSRLLKAAAAIKELEAKLRAQERQRTEPIAIIGMGCRFPGGADDPASYFRLLEAGVDAVSEAPPERFALDAALVPPGDEVLPWGAFLKEVDRFDAQFFGISPREAVKMDPQQRLLLEVAWEALEHAGVAADRLAGSRTGVFVGITTNDYQLLSATAALEEQDAYAATGNGHCFPPGRLSYVLGLEGPSMAVDTACSSSLVAVHLACQSLRSGESSLALAGGVNLILSRLTTRLIAQLQALSPDGRCKTFDARANGFVRGEGCGVVVLKRLSDALSDGDRVLALIRGSAVNQDGRSTGLTAPNFLAQQAMLRQALRSARVSPAEVGYVETHGTGTSLGDPIEVEALAGVLGQPREDGSVCALGAVKSNIGHLEAAAGVAGLIKAVLALEHGVIPANQHFRTLNPRIDLTGTPFVIPSENLPWAAGDKARIAGVSSFGLSGTNAHVVLEEAPRPAAGPDAGERRSAVVVPLSARTPGALAALAQAYHRHLAEAPRDGAASLHDIAATAAVRRSHHEHRAAVVARSTEELADALGALAFDASHASHASRASRPGIAKGRANPASRTRLAFVFSGQGSQWVGMGRGLLAEEPVFRAALEAFDAAVKQHAPFSIASELAAPEASARLDETEVVQPAIAGVQVALSALLASWGVAPDAVIGHSVGEIAAAHVAGVLSVEEAARLAVIRGRVMQRATGGGKMASVSLGAAEAARALEGLEERLCIAAINDPGSVVLSGEAPALAEVVERLGQQGVACRFLNVAYAFHSPQMTPLAGELIAALGPIARRRAALPMYSTVTGARVSGAELDAVYWARNMREPVQLARAVDAAIAEQHRAFLEVAPQPVLSSNLEWCIAASTIEGHAIPTLRRGKDELRCLMQSVGALYACGAAVEFRRLYPGGRVASLPTYPWQRQRYWLSPSPEARSPRRAAAPAHPHSGAALPANGVAPGDAALNGAGAAAGDAAALNGAGAAAGDAAALNGASSDGAAPQGTTAWVERLMALPVEARPAEVEAAVRADVAAVLLLPDASAVPTDCALRELGMDSLMAVDLRHELSARTGQPMPSTLAYEHPTVQLLTRYLLDHLPPAESAALPPAESAAPPPPESAARG
ncbi:beta-ketoacyl synthase N-terminal-like domain-containing protein [Sorangium sp. So ce291]|uniref:type I polyketide synthase n=1 Tax=Sorangium sp. So ce291 TaxID=3133294 RepID=UPI003F63065C